MSEIIIKFPYKEINIPRCCCHCGDYEIAEKIEIARPAPKATNISKQGIGVNRKSKSINVPAYLCEKCLNQIKTKKKIYSILSTAILILFLLTVWKFALPAIYNIAQANNGRLGGLVMFFLGLLSIIAVFITIGINASMVNRFNGIQILSYSPRRIVIRFYNETLAKKFMDLNNIDEEYIIKKK